MSAAELLVLSRKLPLNTSADYVYDNANVQRLRELGNRIVSKRNHSSLTWARR